MQIKSDGTLDHSEKENSNNWRKKADFLKLSGIFPISISFLKTETFICDTIWILKHN